MAEFKLGRLKFVWKGAWTASATYVKDDVVRVSGKSYVCVQGHVATGNFYDDLGDAYWQLMNDGVAWRGNWDSSIYYNLNDLVRWGGNVYICNTAHTSNPSFDDTKFEVFSLGVQFDDNWDAETEYQVGDIVTYGGYSYIAQLRNTNTNPAANSGNHNDEWRVLTPGYNNRDVWEVSTNYKVGDVVRHGGYVYTSVNDSTGENPHENPTYWEILVEGFNWRSLWQAAVKYEMNDIVRVGTSTYICINPHISASGTNDPESASAATYWESFAEGDVSDLFSTIGDMLYYAVDGTRPLSIGAVNAVLQVNDDGDAPEWTRGINIDTVTATLDIESTAGDITAQAGNVIVDPTGTAAAKVLVGKDAALYALDDGVGSGRVGFTDASAIFANDVDAFAQFAIVNGNAGPAASTDLIAYTDTGDNDSGWVDLGITSSGFDASSGYGITGVHDGYIFMSAPAGTTGNGNLVVATNDTGLQNDIVFCTGGFDITTNADAEKMRLIGTSRISASFTASISDNIMTVTAISEGTITNYKDIFSTAAGFRGGTRIQNQLTGTAGSTGTYTLSETYNPSEYTDITVIQYETYAGVVVAIDTQSYDTGTGALRVLGGIASTGNLNIEGDVVSYGGAIYQGRDGGVTAKQLTYDYHVHDVTSEITSISKSGTTVSIVYAADAVNLPTAAVGNKIEIEDYTGTDDTALVAYHTITGHNTGTRTITFTVAGITGTATYTLANFNLVKLYGEDARVGITDASGVFTGDADGFVQFALKNHNNGTSASTDIIAYAANGDNESGWIDMGITSGTYADATYGVTGPDDGYIFMKAPTGTDGNGNLFLSTSDTGVQNDIVFSTGGFGAGNERVRIIGADRVGATAGVEIYAPTQSTSTTTGALRVEGGIGLAGNLNVGGDVNIVGTITIGGSGSSLTTTTLAVSDPMIKLGRGNSADIIDLGTYGIYSTASTTLDGNITNSSTSIVLTDATAFGNTGNAFIGDEEITWTGKSSNTLTGVTRGVNSTAATSHSSGATIFVPKYAGVVRDATDGVFKVFSNLTGQSPTSTIDFTGVTYADVRVGAITAGGNVDITGALSSSGNLTVNTDKFVVTASSGNTSIAGTLGVTGNTTLTGTLAVNGSALTTTASTFALVNTGATTVNFAGAATALSVGASTGTTTINNLIEVGQISERLNTKSGATGVVTHDFSTGDIWYHSGISANFTLNLTNVPTTNNRALTATLVLSQGGTGYIPNAFQIDGVGQTIKWAYNVTPTPGTNKIDTVTFTLIRQSSSWIVLGQLTSFA